MLGMKLMDFNRTIVHTNLRMLTKCNYIQNNLKKQSTAVCLVWFAVNGFLSKTYWSSGYGVSAGSFGWCTANTTIDAGLWKQGEPGAVSGCVTVTFPKIPRNATGGKMVFDGSIIKKINLNIRCFCVWRFPGGGRM
jgi:hypothetical protein